MLPPLIDTRAKVHEPERTFLGFLVFPKPNLACIP